MISCFLSLSKYVVLVFSVILVVNLPAAAQRTLLQEDFNTSAPPGWTIQTPWKIGTWQTQQSRNFVPPFRQDTFAALNDDACQCDASQKRLISPVFSLSNVRGALLEFDAYFEKNSYSGLVESAFIDISFNLGESWERLDTLESNPNTWQAITLNLGRFINRPNVQIAFVYDDNGGNMWGLAIDRVRITEQARYDVAMLFLRLQDKPYLTSESQILDGFLQNRGLRTITELRLYWQLDREPIQADTITNLNIRPGEVYFFQHLDRMRHLGARYQTVKLWSSHPSDTNRTNDTLIHHFSGLNGVVKKTVLTELYSSVNCGLCPEFDFALQSSTLPIIPVTVHATVPERLAVPEAQAFVRPFGANEPPSILVDRIRFEGEATPTLRRSTWQNRVRQRLDTPTPAEVRVARQTYNTAIRRLDAVVTTRFYGPDSGNYRLNLWVVEDSISAEHSSLSQRNARNQDPSSIFYQQGNPIRGYMHRHVLRLYAAGPDGRSGVIPPKIKADALINTTFTLTLPNTINEANVRLIAVLEKVTDTQREVINSHIMDLDLLELEVGSPETIICGRVADIFPKTNKTQNVRYEWAPADQLEDFESLNIVVGPCKTTTYTLCGNYGGQVVCDEKIIRVIIPLSYEVDTNAIATPPFTFNFTNRTPNPENYRFLWDFGDGNKSEDINPSYTYPKEGKYVVSLTAKHKTRCCEDTLVAQYYLFTGKFVNRTGQVPPNTKLTIYPNPTQSELQVFLPYFGVKTITVFDAQAKRTFLDTTTSEKYTLDVANWLAGCYNLIVQTETARYTTRFIKTP